MAEFLEANYGKFRIFTYAGFKQKSYKLLGFRLVPFGYAEEVVRDTVEGQKKHAWDFDPGEWIREAGAALPPSPGFLNMSEAKYPMYEYVRVPVVTLL